MIDQPRRIMLRKKWFPVSSRRSPPSSLIPKLGRWPRQSLVQSNFSTRKRVPDPTQSLMDGLDSSSWTTDTTSSALWMFCSQPTRREIIPQAWSQLRRWFQRKDTINKVFWRNFGKNSWNNNKLKPFYLVWPRVPIRQCVWLFRRLQNAAVLNRPWHINKWGMSRHIDSSPLERYCQPYVDQGFSYQYHPNDYSFICGSFIFGCK